MKTHTSPVIQFSGYPLAKAEVRLLTVKPKVSLLLPFVSDKKYFQKSFPVNEMANNPLNWDDDWFNHYE
jgi:hypothetical protein